MRRHRLLLVLAALVLAVVGLAPVADPLHAQAANSAPDAGVSSGELFGSIIQDAKWRTNVIPVCWENPKPEDASYREIARQAVAETWERYAMLTFTGWEACRADDLGVRIAVRDDAPHTRNVGRYISGMPEGMVLNFTFQAWGPYCQDRAEFCAYAEAVHEFGHAIGFTHEQNRRDAPLRCRREAQGPDGDFNLTKYDPISVMNYCNPNWAGDGHLSPLDIQAVQTIYGARL